MVIRRHWSALALTGLLVVSGCGGAEVALPKNLAPTAPSAVQGSFADVAMTRPGKFDHRLESPDIQIQSRATLPAALVARARKTKGVVASNQFSLATFYTQENPITYAAVDPSTFRYFSPGPTAELDEVWDRIADGEIALRPDLRQSLANPDNYVPLGNDTDALRAHVGAYAELIDRSPIGAIINERWAAKLRMPSGNALLVSTGNHAPQPVMKALRKVLKGSGATVTLLAPDVDPNLAQTAVLTGGSVAQAVGSFTYTANADGTVNPDPAWISQYIRTERVPIIGDVTCNKVMIPQLVAALNDVVKSGLAKYNHPSQYGGCFVPRFIANNPAQGLSFHTFGTAIDLNVPENERGTVGQMNRGVVAIFERWGFNWGGNWSYTDPMHFELARLVAVK